VIREYRALTDCTVTIALDRTRIGPWGFAGGRSAARMEVEIHRADGERISIARLGGKVTGLRVGAGDSMVILSPGGGGWGPPFERAVEAVERDVRWGYVSAERALSDYGVKIEATTMAVDRSVTERARAGMRSSHRNEELYGFDIELPEFAELNRAAYPRALANGLGDLLNPTRAAEKLSGNMGEG
jgi:N-methylhydantoinase B